MSRKWVSRFPSQVSVPDRSTFATSTRRRADKAIRRDCPQNGEARDLNSQSLQRAARLGHTLADAALVPPHRSRDDGEPARPPIELGAGSTESTLDAEMLPRPAPHEPGVSASDSGQRAAASFAASHLALTRSRAETSSPIRRKVGFEFETTGLLKAPGGLLGPDTPVIEGDGWDLVPDMRLPPQGFAEVREESVGGLMGWLGVTKKILPKFQGYGNMEFRTSAFEENDTGYDDLLRAVYQINLLLEFLLGKSDYPLREVVRGVRHWGAYVASKDTKDDIEVDVPQDLRITPQVSVGIQLSQVAYFLQELARDDTIGNKIFGRSAPLARGQQRALYGNALTEAVRVAKGNPFWDWMDRDAKKTYVGAVAHLAEIIRAGATFRGAKTKYLAPILSRTDFGKLPDSVRKNWKFKSDVIAAGGRAGDLQLMPQSSAANVTINDWIDGIIVGKDPLDWGQDRKDPEKTRRWDPQKVGEEGDQALGHVYEFRGLAPIKVDELVGFAKEYYEMVKTINRLGKQ